MFGRPSYAVGRKVVILSLLPVGDHRRARGLELGDCVVDGFVVKRLNPRMRAAIQFDSFQQF